jgi:Mg-chelatase subunit ChlD
VVAELESETEPRIIELEEDADEPQEPGERGSGQAGSGASGTETEDVEPNGMAAEEELADGQGVGGGGGRAGGGVGGGMFFESGEVAKTIVYVIDRSGSMGERGRLERAKAELLASVGRLREGTRFAVIFFNHELMWFEGSKEREWLEPTAVNRARLAEWLEKVDARGGTIPRPVLEAALELGPEAIYFVTDGHELAVGDADRLAERARSTATRFYTIDLGATGRQGAGAPLRRLAEATGGSYRAVGM